MIIRRLIDTCWFFFKWMLVLAVSGGLVVAALVYARLDDEIRRQVEHRFADHYRDLTVRVGSARRIDGQGIEIRDLSISDPRLPAAEGRLLHIEEIHIDCATDLVQLACQQLNVRKITVRRPTLHAVALGDGQWSVARLWPLPKLGDRSPELVVERGVLEIAPQVAKKGPLIVLRDIDLRLASSSGPGGGSAGPAPLKLDGTLSADFLQRAEFGGLLDLPRKRWQVGGTLAGIRVGNPLLAFLPSTFARQMPAVGQLAAEANLRFEVSHDAARVPSYQFSVSSDIVQGRLESPRLPDAVTDVAAHLQLTHEGMAVERLAARCGAATLRLDAQRDGWGTAAPVSVRLDVQDLELTRRLAEGLPASLQQLWRKYQPTGKANLAVKARYDGHRWLPDLVLRFVDTGFLYEKFPYAVEHSTGTLRLRENRANFHLVTQAGGQPVEIEGEVIDPGPTATGWAHVWGRDLRVDRRLIEALPEKPRRFVQSLRPAARVHFDWRASREDPLAPKPAQQLLLQVVDGAICFDKFPYPLDKVHGQARWIDHKWELTDFVARNGTAVVTLSGQMEPTGRGTENRLTLRIDAHDVPLDKQLRAALNDQVQRCWEAIEPRGQVDLGIDLTHFSGQPVSDIAVQITPLPETASVHLTAFPYLLKNIRGSFHYAHGQVVWQRAGADHGETRIACDGQFIKRLDGQWHLHLGGLEVERLQGDRDLLSALPPQLRKAVVALDPRGMILLSGTVDLRGHTASHVPLRADWDLRFDAHQAQIDCGIRLDNVRGAVRLSGRAVGSRFRASGELDIDSLNWNGFPLTQLRGPLLVQGERVLLGSWVGKEQAQTPRSLTARLYGGTLVGDGWAMVGTHPQYAVHAVLTNGDLARFVGPPQHVQHKLRGKLFGQITLQGRNADLKSLTGSGTAQLRDADLYELPVMVALLKVLSARLPDTTAFTESNAEFRIRGRQIRFDRLDLLGDAVNLYGQGTADFDRNIELAFHTNFRKSDLPLPIVRNVLGAASQQILQLRVDGTLDHPRIRTQAFPAMNQALQQLQLDQQQTARRPARRLTDPRTWFGWDSDRLQRR